jgi:hypothetical protein
MRDAVRRAAPLVVIGDSRTGIMAQTPLEPGHDRDRLHSSHSESIAPRVRSLTRGFQIWTAQLSLQSLLASVAR